MKEIKQKWYVSRLLCKHEFESLDDMREFFGIMQCSQCGEYGQMSLDEMQVTEFSCRIKIEEDKKC
jgi:hypothetical protein